MSFAAGAGQWVGSAKVYDAEGNVAGPGKDQRTITQNPDGSTTVDVSFDGPFSFAGTYRIESVGSQRRYLGPLNLGAAESVGDNVVEAHNYWHGLGLSQRFLLAIAPEGDAQFSLATLSSGEQLVWVVIGENRRPDAPEPPEPLTNSLTRPGRWVGDLPSGRYFEELNADGSATVSAPSGVVALNEADSKATSLWTTGEDPARLSGSATLIAGRALSGSFILPCEGLHLSRREVASADGSRKAIVHRWSRGSETIALVAGVVRFEPTN